VFEDSPFAVPGRWIKAGFHCHTVHSDGGLTPQATVARYRELGFDCLGITDHRGVTAVDDLGGNGILLIPSTENGGEPDILAIGVREAVAKTLPFAERVRRLADQGGFTVAAHPTHCALTPEALAACPDLMAMEIYNAYCEEAYGSGVATELWDMMLGQGKRLWGVAGDDAHLNPQKRHYSDAGRAWVEVWAGQLQSEAVLDALKRGAFYSTQGPKFERIEVSRSGISIQTTPVVQIRWRTYGPRGFVVHAPPGAALNHASLPDPFEPAGFVRIELVDGGGMKAWSNPLFLAS